VLLSNDGDEKGMADNIKIRDDFMNGNPAKRGEMLAARMAEAMEVFRDVTSREVSDQEIIENLEKFHRMQDMFTNAQNFIKLYEDRKFPYPIGITVEMMEQLKFMEKNSPKADIFMQRAKMVSNANYEYVDFKKMMTADPYTYKWFTQYTDAELTGGKVNDEGDVVRTMLEDDMQVFVRDARDRVYLNRRVALYDQIAQDFRIFLEQDDTIEVKITHIDENNSRQTAKYDPQNGMNDPLARSLEKGYVLVEFSDRVKCYHLDEKGELTVAEPTDMLNDFGPELRGFLQDVKTANKGFFIGSAEYKDAMKKAEALARLVDSKPLPLEFSEEEKQQISTAMSACKTYMGTKDPDAFKYERERVRYFAMEKVYNCCLRQQAFMELQPDAIAKAAASPTKELVKAQSDEDAADLKAQYAKAFENERKKEALQNTDYALKNAISSFKGRYVYESVDGGKVLKELHQFALGQMNATFENHCESREDVLEVMAIMVVLESALMGRSGSNYKPTASPMEMHIATEGFGGLIEATLDNDVFKAMTENVSLRDFMVDGKAKEIATQMQNIALHRKEASEQLIQEQPKPEMEKSQPSV
jgi:hypothetical protein